MGHLWQFLAPARIATRFSSKNFLMRNPGYVKNANQMLFLYGGYECCALIASVIFSEKFLKESYCLTTLCWSIIPWRLVQQFFNTPGNEIAVGSDVIRKYFQHMLWCYRLFFLMLYTSFGAIYNSAAALTGKYQPSIRKTCAVVCVDGSIRSTKITIGGRAYPVNLIIKIFMHTCWRDTTIVNKACPIIEGEFLPFVTKILAHSRARNATRLPGWVSSTPTRLIVFERASMYCSKSISMVVRFVRGVVLYFLE